LTLNPIYKITPKDIELRIISALGFAPGCKQVE
jgi:hypothetical protein